MRQRIVMDLDKRKWKVSLLPGQIVFVSTLDKRGTPNVAPKSWVSMVSLGPPVLGFGCNLKHRTARNIFETKEFVLNIPDEGLAKKAWETAESPHDSFNSIRKLGFALAPSAKVSVPRIQQCRAHLECIYDSDRRYEDEVWIFGKIAHVSAEKTLLQGSIQERYKRLDPIFYLEEKTYGTLGKVHNLAM